jgi:hypothetical protein
VLAIYLWRPINSTFGNDKVLTYFSEVPIGFTARDAYNVLDPALYPVYRKKYIPKMLVKELWHSQEFSEKIYDMVKKHIIEGPYHILRF